MNRQRKNEDRIAQAGIMGTLGTGMLIIAILAFGVTGGILLHTHWPFGDGPADAPDAGDYGLIVELGELVTNIATEVPGRDRYVHLEIDLLVEGDATRDALSVYSSPIRREILSIVRGTKVSQVEGRDGLDRLAEEIADSINDIIDPLEVDDVFFTEFLIQ